MAQKTGTRQRKADTRNEKRRVVIGMEEIRDLNRLCESCVEGKAHRKTHHGLETKRTVRIMDLWHIDLIGPVRPSTMGGKLYILTVVDDYSRFIFVELLREKSETREILKKLIIQKENETRMKLKAIRSDNGGEFVDGDLNEWMKDRGIKHEYSPPWTPQCNGLVERTNRTIIEMTRSMISDSKIPMSFWGEAVCTAVHIKNRVKSSVHGKTPYELWKGRKPNIKYMRRFGCVAYALEKGYKKQKFESKTIKGIFVGYATNNTYRIYLPERKKILCDCDVKFDEEKNWTDIFIEKEINENKQEIIELTIMGIDDENESEENEIEIDIEDNSRENNEAIEPENQEENNEENNEEERDENNMRIEEIRDREEIQDNNENNERAGIPRTRGRPKGSTREVIKVRELIERENRERESEENNVRRSLRLINKNSAMLVIEREIPKNVEEAKNSENWKDWKNAMDEEMQSMKKHKVWDIVQQPEGKRVINNKWVFSIKEDPNKKELRYRARLVAIGCAQRPGHDFDETFAPVARTETIRLFYSIAAEKGRKIKLYDVRTAFLHGKLDNELYMRTPSGYQYGKDTVCKLQKSIYGLKQAGKCWNDYMTEELIKIGLHQSREDQCVFYMREGQQFLFCCVHVDDIIVIASDDKIEQYYMRKISKKLDIKDMGVAKNFLGLQIEQEKGKINVHQRDYTEKLLKMYRMDECNSVSTPLDVNVKLENDENSNKCNEKDYQELVGRLMYLSVNTRPDITHAITSLSQFSNNPKELHMNSLKRVLRYLKGTIDYKLCFGKKNEKNKIECDTDASWDATKDAKSFTGLLVYRNGDLIHWRSKKQTIVALSSTESELEAITEGVKEVIWTESLLKEMTGQVEIFKEIKCDNLNVVKLANGGSYKARSKLLNRRCCFVKENVKKNNICITHVRSEHMRADYLTKALSTSKFIKNIKNILDINNQ